MKSAETKVSHLCKRIIPCLDVAAGRTVKGVNFTGLRDVGDPIELAMRYEEEGADELVFLDITATVENRDTLLHTVEKVADCLRIPFTVGGGIKSIENADLLLKNGADKVSVNSAAVSDPSLIAAIADKYGSQCCVLAIDARRVKTEENEEAEFLSISPWQVLVNGGRKPLAIDALAWAKEAVKLGAGEILLTSFDRDGTQIGFDLPMVEVFAKELSVPVIASGGAGSPECFVDVFKEAGADAALAASILHDDKYKIQTIKETLRQNNIEVRL
ncbi:MAG: imidazole glycerol phosphate synthase subunit HisF [Candidatus Obscuribacterales bacterium]|nr:imidazole glycerol phosphate synthase subunit HisF [Candidatus Obscuribacterales bacterium]